MVSNVAMAAAKREHFPKKPARDLIRGRRRTCESNGTKPRPGPPCRFFPRGHRWSMEAEWLAQGGKRLATLPRRKATRRPVEEPAQHIQ
jgi:hypothetical protein